MTVDTFTVEQHLGPFDDCHPLRTADYAGVYFLFRRRSIVYVGKTKSVATRISQHRVSKDFDTVLVMRVPEELLETIEMQWIKRLRPKLNHRDTLLLPETENCLGLDRMMTERRMGRPLKGQKHVALVRVNYRITPAVFKMLKKASRLTKLTQTAYVEQALKEKFERDGITKPEPLSQ